MPRSTGASTLLLASTVAIVSGKYEVTSTGTPSYASCQLLDDAEDDQLERHHEQCSFWCTSYTCSSSSCTGCSVCTSLERGEVCEAWCVTPHTCGMQHCKGCKSCSTPKTPEWGCVAPYSPPPNVLGVFQFGGTGHNLESNSTRLDAAPDDKQWYLRFSETVPANPAYVVLEYVDRSFYREKDQKECPSADYPGCVEGFQSTTSRRACKWTWSCLYTLYCTDNDDTSFTLFEPMRFLDRSRRSRRARALGVTLGMRRDAESQESSPVDPSLEVLQLEMTLLETGPAHLVASGRPNPYHTSHIGSATFCRVQ